MLSGLPDFFLHLTRNPPEGLHAWACSCGLSSVNSSGYSLSGDYPSHQGRSIFQYTLEGTGYLEFLGVEYAIPAGHAMLLQPPGDHRYFARDGVRWRFFFLTLEGDDAAQYWRQAMHRAGPVRKFDESSATFQHASAVVRRRYDRPGPADPWEDGHDAYAMCLALLRDIREERDEGDTVRHRALRQVTDYVQRHLSEDLGVDVLARIAGMSRYHFTRIFRAHTGHPPGEYVLQARLRRARHLLKATRKTVQEVAFASGFNDANYFSRLFRARTGISPRHFRQGDAR